jgi:signal transduction histidine kinase
MAWQFHPLLVLFAFGGFVSLLVFGYCWRYMHHHGRSYLVLAIALLGLNNAIWVFAAMLKTASADLAASILFYKLELVGLLPNTAVAIVLALAYVGKDWWLTRRKIGLLGLVPIAFLSLVWIDPGGVMIAAPELLPAQGILAFEHEFSPVFTLYLAWVYGAALFASLIIAWGVVTDKVPTTPAVVGIVALALPLVAGLLKTVGLYPPGGEGINVAPAASAIGISIFAFGVIRYRVFELIPVGRARAIEAMREGYLLVGPNRTILDANPAAGELLGEHASAGLRNRAVNEILPSDDLTETHPVDCDIAGRTIELRRSRVAREAQYAGDVLLLHDVTENRRQQRELEHTNERLDRFASTVSHDLRNPLNVAQLRLELAMEDCESEHLAAVEDAHERMESLIDDLLALARQGDAVENPEAVALAELVQSCWRTVEAPEATLIVETEQTIRADRSRLRQLLANLFRNAVEHAGTDVTITVGSMEDGFYVADDGAGIPEAERHKAFDAGYSTVSGNTGFGLNIIQEIADAHEWHIQITESDAGGARFEITGVEFVE